MRAGDPTRLDLAVGVLALVTVFLAAWAEMGIALPIIAGVFLLYCFFGQHAPGLLQTRGYDFAQVIEHMAYGTEGIYGIPTYVSSSYIFLFILFGAFLEKAGMIRLFTDVSLGLVGHLLGGPAKVAVFSSALMGTISGSGVANVVTTGQFTIPLMKRFGYRAAFAGGVEATASMGGQIMPPVMGAVAFIMAETLGVEYIEIVKAALIPAILYFGAAFWMVHLEAGRRGLVGACGPCPNPAARDSCPAAPVQPDRVRPADGQVAEGGARPRHTAHPWGNAPRTESRSGNPPDARSGAGCPLPCQRRSAGRHRCTGRR